jgi:galactose mutarotase-like enzyme
MGEIEAAKKENVLIRAGDCAVTVLPRFGGKIASIRLGDQELLQGPLAAYGPRTRTMNFDASDASGWDECLPSVAACTLETEAATVSIPDHGDLWRVEWSSADHGPRTGDKGPENRERGLGNSHSAGAQSSKDASKEPVTLRGDCFSLPLSLERKVALTETPKGWELRLDYSVINTGSAPMPWSWSAHPLFAAEAGDRIVLPASIETARVEGSRGGRLGNYGDLVTWPLATLGNGSHTDLSVVQGPESGIGDKLFAGPLKEGEDWCALERRKAGVTLRVRFDPALTPYLGLWICNGGWPERPGAKQMCVALEPATAPVDSLAHTGPWSRVLAPKEAFSWPMTVEIETI